MEEENNKKRIDTFLQKYIQEIPLESPSKDFTKNLMEVLTKEETTKVTAYTPLISKKGWGIIASIIAIFSTVVVFIPYREEEQSLIDKIPVDFSFLSHISFSKMFEILSVSNSTLYTLVLFTVLFFVQAFYLKGYLHKKI